jgi:hypothetical protein
MPANYVLLERIELNASAASVTFSNIPQTGYTDLKVVMSMRSADTSNIAFECSLTFNGNTTGYTAKQLYGDGSAAASTSPTVRPAGFIVGTSATANTFSNGELYIPNYASGNNKSYSVDSVTETNATTQYMNLIAGLWSNTAAITSIALAGTSGSFAANSTFSLYGLAATGTTPTIAPKASGGNVIATDGTYWYHAFLSSGTFNLQSAVTCDVLQVAGGGGGGYFYGGGGAGAGGISYVTAQPLSIANYSVVVGAGASMNTVGNNSQFASLTAAAGGGYGGSDDPTGNGGNGGCGGGAGATGGGRTGGTGSQGFNGGTSSQSSGNNQGGGGGGMGGNGVNGPSGRTGGIGTSAYSSWGSITSTGQNSSGTYYYSGGGGGGSFLISGNSNAQSSGGVGGGGQGVSDRSPIRSSNINATPNTGGGGGGGSEQFIAGNGGSGIIIIRYPIT